MTRLLELKDRIESREARIGVIGLGYVGLPLALEFAKAGFRVTGVELNSEKVRTLCEGRSYIEDVPEAEVREATQSGRFAATTDGAELSAIDVINVCVPTPLTRTKDPDVSAMVAALETIQRRLRSGQLVILGSTTYPGTTHELFVPMLESTGLKLGRDFALAFAPERIDPANTEFTVRQVPKVVGGETPLCTELGVKVFETIFDTVKRLNREEGVSFLLAEQNTNMALKYATYGYILENGRVVLDGDAATLASNEDVKEFYLGLSAGGRKSYRDVKHYKRRKRWLA